MTTSAHAWYKDAVIYQLHVRSFYDANGDGIGDFRGLTQKLDYLQELGVTALWLLPFYPSPLKDDGYDIADYRSINPDYGTLEDFQAFLHEAHQRGLRVITELVLNHCSDQHEWFQQARRAKPGDPIRDYFVWSDTPEKYQDARIIFKDFEPSNWSWDAVAGAHYWHRFYHHQPDLNYDNPAVRQEMMQILDHWLSMGVDGLRLDAVPYLFEREGTTCENLPETHAALKELRAYVDARFEDRMLLAEANQWPEDAVAYFGDGDECHAAFHFPVMPRLFMAVQMEDRFPVIDIMLQTPPIPENCQWFLFLRNHDELTLEMVTDEERDYMYRMYARDPQARINLGIRHRLAPLLGNDRRKIELLNGLLMSLPGTPVVYYGDEIGMGDNIFLGDRDGVRTPMQWSSDRNAGFSRASSQRLYLPVISDFEYHYEALNVETQQRHVSSLLSWMKRLIAVRQQHSVFGTGSLKFLTPDNGRVLAFVREDEQQRILVVANLSRSAQFVQLDLSEWEGDSLTELFGGGHFPQIGKLPYLLTLGPYAFYWFTLNPAHTARLPSQTLTQPLSRPQETEKRSLPTVRASGTWMNLFSGRTQNRVAATLPSFLNRQSWFLGQSRRIQEISILDVVPLGVNEAEPEICMLLIEVNYHSGEPETYALPLGIGSEETLPWGEGSGEPSILARFQIDGDRPMSGVLYDAATNPRFHELLIDIVAQRRQLRGREGLLTGKALTAALTSSDTEKTEAEPFELKLFRRVEEGISPDVEIRKFLAEEGSFPHIVPLVGTIQYEQQREPWTVGLLQEQVMHEGTAWDYTLNVLSRILEEAVADPKAEAPPQIGLRTASLLQAAAAGLPQELLDLCGSYLSEAELLGQRAAEMHRALASAPYGTPFSVEPFTLFYQRALYQRVRSRIVRSLATLRRKRGELPEEACALIPDPDQLEQRSLEQIEWILQRKVRATRIRAHGNFHLGNVLYTGKDLLITNFEGLPGRPITERRIKRTPLGDVTDMLYSLHDACAAVLAEHTARGLLASEQIPRLEAWLHSWLAGSAATLLHTYLATAGDAAWLPPNRDDMIQLLDMFRLEKAYIQLTHALAQQLDELDDALRGISHLLEGE